MAMMLDRLTREANQNWSEDDRVVMQLHIWHAGSPGAFAEAGERDHDGRTVDGRRTGMPSRAPAE